MTSARVGQCFFVGPICAEGSSTRHRADNILASVIRPAAMSLDLAVIRPDQISGPGLISQQIIQHLVEDDVVVADLSGNNPNVLYGVGVRQSLGKPLVLLTDDASSVPFDIADMRFLVIDDTDQASLAGAATVLHRLMADGLDGRTLSRGVSLPVRPKVAHDDQVTLFISHASEDKPAVARPLAQELASRKVDVWLDEFSLTLGDSLSREINRGLATSNFGVVILSRAFFAKDWPQWELDGLLARESASGNKVILPIWHEISAVELARYSPVLAGRLGISSSKGPSAIADAILAAVAAAQDSGASEPLVRVLPEVESSPVRHDVEPGHVRQSAKVRLLEILAALVPGQFAEVLFRADVPDRYLPDGASQTERAIAAIQYLGKRRQEMLVVALREVVPELMDGFGADG